MSAYRDIGPLFCRRTLTLAGSNVRARDTPSASPGGEAGVDANRRNGYLTYTFR